MKKKKLTKRLTLNKDTITSLNSNEMKNIKGAVSILFACTESCSVLVACCGPTRNNNIDGNLIQDKANG